MNWQVSFVEENGLRYACVKDSYGAIIRQISEYSLWEIFDEPNVDSTKGQLLKKTA